MLPDLDIAVQDAVRTVTSIRAPLSGPTVAAAHALIHLVHQAKALGPAGGFNAHLRRVQIEDMNATLVTESTRGLLT
jgi:hypothetical protein